MRAPAFWSNPPEAPGWQAPLLAPLSLAWRLGAWLRARRRPWRAPVPVICVGNLTAGGAGKTPLAGALLDRLAARTPHALSRGHGGRLHGPHRVDPAHDTAAQVGDEPLLLAARAPAWIARDRAAGARAAVAAGAGCIVMDDGLQNPSLERDLSILVVDAGAGFGNARVIPAGPLREPLAEGLARVDLTVLVGPEPARVRALAHWPDLAALDPVAAEIRTAPEAPDLGGERVLAFAGIGRPEKFFDTLRAMGAEVVAAVAFPDHHAFSPADLARLRERAEAMGARLVTTGKDAVRLPPAFRARVITLPVVLVALDWTRLDAALALALDTASGETRPR